MTFPPSDINCGVFCAFLKNQWFKSFFMVDSFIRKALYKVSHYSDSKCYKYKWKYFFFEKRNNVVNSR